MRNRMAACALLCVSVYADDLTPPPSNHYQNGSDATAKQKVGSTAVSRGHAPIHGEPKDSARAPDFASDEASIRWAPDPAREGRFFLLQREHDVAVRLLTTNIALRFKLATDGVYLNLAF